MQITFPIPALNGQSSLETIWTSLGHPWVSGQPRADILATSLDAFVLSETLHVTS